MRVEPLEPRRLLSGKGLIAPEPIEAAPPHIDLAVEHRRADVDASLVTGSKSKGKVVFDIVSGAGSLDTLKKGVKIDVAVCLRPAGATDASGDILISKSSARAKLGQLKPGQAKTCKLGTRIGRDTPAGEYQIVIKINADGRLAESDLANNEIVLEQTVTIAPAFIDLSPRVLEGKSNLPDEVTAGQDVIKLTIRVANEGNVRADRSMRATLTVTAVSVDDGEATPIQTYDNIQLFKKKGRSLTMTLTFKMPEGADAGDYVLRVGVQAGDAIPEPGAHTDNNSADTSHRVSVEAAPEAAATDFTFAYFEHNLAGSETEGADSSIHAGVRFRGDASVVGNVRVRYFASSSGVLDGSAVAISGVSLWPNTWHDGSFREISTAITLPNVDAATGYTILAQLDFDPEAGLGESVTSNNAVVVKTLTVTPKPEPPVETDDVPGIFGTITGFTRTGFTDSRVGGRGATIETGTLTTSTGLSTTYRYRVPFGGPSAPTAAQLYIDAGDFTVTGDTLDDEAIFPLGFKTPESRPTTLVGHSLVFINGHHTGDSGSAQLLAATINGQRTIVEAMSFTLT